MRLSDLSEQLEDFLEKTREVVLLGDEKLTPSKVSKQLEEDYRKLQLAFSKLSNASVSRVLKNHPQAVSQALIEHLVLGKGAVLDVMRPMIRLVEDDPEKTDWAISKFTSTDDGFNVLNGVKEVDGRQKKKGSLTDEEKNEFEERQAQLLSVILGVDGLKLSAEFARKVRGELLCSAIGYAHAKLCKKDLKRWKNDQSLRERYGDDVEQYLCDCMTTSNIKLVYGTRANEGAPHELACAMVEHGAGARSINLDEVLDDEDEAEGARRSKLGGTANKQEADCFFVNHDEKLFVIGSATTHVKDDLKQMETLVRQYRGLEFLIENDPKYKDYKIDPFFLHSGYFCAEGDPRGKNSHFVKSLRASGMKEEHVNALALSAFYNLLAERNPSPTAGRVFAELNPHLGGCVTLTQYFFREKSRRTKPELRTRRNALIVLKHIETIGEALVSPAFDLVDSGPRGVLISGYINIMSNFYMLFPVKKDEALPAKEERLLERISNNMGVLSRKIQDSSVFGAYGNTLRRLSLDYSTVASRNESIEAQRRSAENKGRFVYSEEIKQAVERRHGVFDVDDRTIRAHGTNFLEPLSRGEAVPIIQAAIDYCRKSPDIVLSDYEATMLERAEEAIANMKTLSGVRASPNRQKGGLGSNESFVQSFRNCALAQKTEGGNIAAATFGMLTALFQMDMEMLQGKRRSVVFVRNATTFLKQCLETQDSSPNGLASLALATLSKDTPDNSPFLKKKRLKV